MTTAPIAADNPVLSVAERKARRNGLFRVGLYGVVGALMVYVGLQTPADQVTTYKLVFDTAAIKLGPLVLPVGATYVAMGGLTLLAAFLQLRRPSDPGRRFLGLVVLALVIGALTGALAGKEPSLVGLTQATVAFALPIVFAGLAAVLCERSGVFNIGIEGTILFGALATSIGGSLFDNTYLGIVIGATAGLLLGLLLAVLSIRYHVDQIIAGTVLNLAAAGITTFMYVRILQVKQDLNDPGLIGATPIPGLSSVPILGPTFFNGSFYLYLGYVLIILLQFALYRTRWGLRLRASGENPKAAGTIGIDVLRIRYLSLAMGGLLAGLAGSFLVVVSTGSFQINMSSGIGFIGMAAMIFGAWKPIGVAGAALVFGFALAAGSRLSTVGVAIPQVFLSILPYVVTIIVVAGVIGRVRGPAATGQPYEQA
jgi:ABC-type uncharacterized transport system permease subunit